MNEILTLETKKYNIKLENFEGPLDLLCHLVDKNKMDIDKVNISQITDQYIEYLNAMEELNLEIASEFIVMLSTLVYLKSKHLLPKEGEDEEELTEEELIRRIIEYKRYKEIIKLFREKYNTYSKRIFKLPEKIELPNRKLERKYEKEDIAESYRLLVERNENKKNKNAINMEKIAILETVTVASKVKDIFRELVKKHKFIFGALCTSKKYTKLETVTAFSGMLELSRRNKITTEQNKNFGDIIVSKK
jgi:segregation and condensation protein A